MISIFLLFCRLIYTLILLVSHLCLYIAISQFIVWVLIDAEQAGFDSGSQVNSIITFIGFLMLIFLPPLYVAFIQDKLSKGKIFNKIYLALPFSYEINKYIFGRKSASWYYHIFPFVILLLFSSIADISLLFVPIGVEYWDISVFYGVSLEWIPYFILNLFIDSGSYYVLSYVLLFAFIFYEMYYIISSNLPKEIMKPWPARRLCERCKGKGELNGDDLPDNQRYYSRNVNGEIIKYRAMKVFSCSRCNGEGVEIDLDDDDEE